MERNLEILTNVWKSVQDIPANISRKISFRLNLQRRPELNDVENVVSYVRGNIANVVDYYVGNLPIVYLLPDVHKNMSMQFHNVSIIDKLAQRLGLDLVGVEGFSGNVDQTALEDIVKKANAKIKEQQGTITILYTLDSIAAVKSYLRYALNNSKVELVGLEYPELYEKALLIDEAMSLYNKIFERASKLLTKKQFREIREEEGGLKKLFDIGQATLDSFIRAFEEEYVPFLEKFPFKDELPDYKESLKEVSVVESVSFVPSGSSFYRALLKLCNKYIILERSLGVADKAIEESQVRGKQQIAVTFGRGHIPQISHALRDRNVSYIVMI